MFNKIATKIVGSRNDRLVKKMYKIVDKVNAFEDEVQALSDEELKAKTEAFRQRHEAGESLDALMPEAFAVVREVGQRVLGMRHFDVQMIGGMVLDQGKIAEMRTGEGKTLVATLFAYLNALPGRGVHVVTVNDYLARRDAGWMGRLYNALGMTTGVINSSGGIAATSAISCSSMRLQPPPCRSRCLERARSTRIRRMASAAEAKK